MIALGADHGGYQLKNAIKKHLESKGIACKDFGTNSADSVDYPNYALAVANSIKSGECTEGILCCGTGVGISIAANKIDGIRAALVGDVFTAKLTKEHNNSNVLCLGERVIGQGLALMIVDTWLEAGYVGAHHQKRLDLLVELEKNQSC
ncbi:ribose 5-phosphate isomerase B [Propionispora vibrioides]|jgi:ribose 5-phosphate isomerase B|uniref:Ribose-5-phosphate isomerase n=1 Tax=Propionispora vibrioides TaxID=112903 RepID=A0A1H8VP26_9FIRM|nr:ribose 5-phosphate isomerase B [Propionispora vibrioides]SEP16937.1 ribose-5-phosphate isomerase [Propionispora vibrioides]